MANNRIHIVCNVCKAAGAEFDAILIAKYYPNTGWYRKLDGMDARLDAFFEAHNHPEEHGMWGTYISVKREIDED